MRVQNALPRPRPPHWWHVFRLEMVAGGKVAAAKETPSSRVSWRSKLLVFASCSHGGPWTCALLSKETAENCLNHGKSRQTISCYDDALITSVAIILGGLCANLRWLAIHISWRFQGILGCSHIFALEFPWISCKWPLQKPAIQMQSRQHLWQPDAKLLCRPHESPFGSPFGTPRSHHFHAANGLGLNMDPRVPGRPICDHIDIISAWCPLHLNSEQPTSNSLCSRYGQIAKLCQGAAWNAFRMNSWNLFAYCTLSAAQK